MPQQAIPFVMMRGGTSRGPYFRRSDLPTDQSALEEVLLDAVGAGHPLNIDGIGGGAAVTTKVAILSRSDHPDADIDYLFCQLSVTERRADFSPTCGNILTGVPAAAVELGLFEPTGDTASIRVRSVNTGAMVEADIQTPGGLPEYQGEETLDGVPGSAAPVVLKFRNVEGSKTGALFPTGRPRDVIGKTEVTLIDAAMPMIIFRAQDVGLTGQETIQDLAGSELFDRLEPMRLEAGVRMGLGRAPDDLRNSVVPKVGFLAPHEKPGMIHARYMMPQGDRWDPHPSFAVTGSICVAACALAPDTVAAGMLKGVSAPEANLSIAHPSGEIKCRVAFSVDGGALRLDSVGLVRTARKIADGRVYARRMIETVKRKAPGLAAE